MWYKDEVLKIEYDRKSEIDIDSRRLEINQIGQAPWIKIEEKPSGVSTENSIMVRGGNFHLPSRNELDILSRTLALDSYGDWYIGSLDEMYIQWLNTMQSEFSDWFLPSAYELVAMYENLHVHGVGGFRDAVGSTYWSSTEAIATDARRVFFEDAPDFGIVAGEVRNLQKGASNRIRQCRTFRAPRGAFQLRDKGPADGWIFYIEDIEDEYSKYYEAAPEDYYDGETFIFPWSNITDTAIGTTSYDIGAGQDNTTAIIAQEGHTDSSALKCDEYEKVLVPTVDAVIGRWTSTEVDDSNAYAVADIDIPEFSFIAGDVVPITKDEELPVQPIRHFYDVDTAYEIRDPGSVTGNSVIFHKEKLGNGYAKYYEIRTGEGNHSWKQWTISGLTSTLLDKTSSEVGTGLNNTLYMRNQVGFPDELEEAFGFALSMRIGTRNKLISTTEAFLTSTEGTGLPDTKGVLVHFLDGIHLRLLKSNNYPFFPVREFESDTFYQIGTTGEYGAVFYIEWTGDKFRYLECAPDRPDDNNYSNVDDVEIGTSEDIWAGKYNTIAIIEQEGHTNSAALVSTEYTGIDNTYNTITKAISETTGSRPYVLVLDQLQYNEDISQADFDNFLWLYSDDGEAEYCTRLLDFEPTNENSKFVSKSGSSDGDGTKEDPVNSITKAIELFPEPITGWFLGSAIEMQEVWRQLIGGEKSQWFLPTKDELGLIYTNIHESDDGEWFLPSKGELNEALSVLHEFEKDIEYSEFQWFLPSRDEMERLWQNIYSDSYCDWYVPSRDELVEMGELLHFAGVGDWYLPSIDELIEMRQELYLHGVGGFSNLTYWSSSERNAAWAWLHYFSTEGVSNYYKNVNNRVRPVRDFTSSTIYQLRDEGPSGGFIFHITDLGGGEYKYYEAAPYGWYNGGDDPTFQWGGRGVLIDNTGTAIGTGKQNTEIIIDFFNSLYLVSDPSISYYNYNWAELTSGTVDFTDGVNTYAMDYRNNGTVAVKLPSEFYIQDPEFIQMGDFKDEEYWSSSGHAVDFSSVTVSSPDRTEEYRIRPIRDFISDTVYSERDPGPAGGIIFIIKDLGENLFKYYECAPQDLEVNSQVTFQFGGRGADPTIEGYGQLSPEIGEGRKNSYLIRTWFDSLRLESDGTTTYYDYDWTSLTEGTVEFIRECPYNENGYESFNLDYRNTGEVGIIEALKYSNGSKTPIDIGLNDGDGDKYLTSSEIDTDIVWAFDFHNEEYTPVDKLASHYIRPIRHFSVIDVYEIGDTGPAGGTIFDIEKLNGLYGYFEVLNTDLEVEAVDTFRWGGKGARVQTTIMGIPHINTVFHGKVNTEQTLIFFNNLVQSDNPAVNYYDFNWEGLVSGTQEFAYDNNGDTLLFDLTHENTGTTAVGDLNDEVNFITVITITKEWYVPNRDELAAIWFNLASHGVGDLAPEYYWTSSQFTATQGVVRSMNTGTQLPANKTSQFRIRPIRDFIGSSGEYQLRDRGPAGGWIFYIEDLGSGICRYYEAAQVDLVIDGNYIFQLGGRGVSIPDIEHTIGKGKTNTQIMVDFFHSIYETAAPNSSYWDYDWESLTEGTVEFTDGVNTYDMDYRNNGETAVVWGHLSYGLFIEDKYWTSSEVDANNATAIDFSSGLDSSEAKSSTHRVRPIRICTSAINKSIKDWFKNGFIFHKEEYGGVYTYYIAYGTDLENTGFEFAWSNVTDLAIGTTGEDFGDGKDNTQDIIDQDGHTQSSANRCFSLSSPEMLGLGDFSGNYWSSSEESDFTAWAMDFDVEGYYNPPKDSEHKVRPIKYFIDTEAEYSIGDEYTPIPGSIVFHYEDIGNGTWRYFVVGSVEMETENIWSDHELIEEEMVGQTSVNIGFAEHNTLIISRFASSDSTAALDCLLIKIDPPEILELSGVYWTSSEYDENTAVAIDMDNGLLYHHPKDLSDGIRAIRTFTTTEEYDIGDENYGIIFHKEEDGGEYTYYEITKEDIVPFDPRISIPWSNITDEYIGIPFEYFGAGLENSQAIKQFTESVSELREENPLSAANECLSYRFSDSLVNNIIIQDSEVYSEPGIIIEGAFRNIIADIGETPEITIHTPVNFWMSDTAFYKVINRPSFFSESGPVQLLRHPNGNFLRVYQHPVYRDIRMQYMNNSFELVGEEFNLGEFVSPEYISLDGRQFPGWKVFIKENGNIVFTHRRDETANWAFRVYSETFELLAHVFRYISGLTAISNPPPTPRNVVVASSVEYGDFAYTVAASYGREWQLSKYVSRSNLRLVKHQRHKEEYDIPESSVTLQTTGNIRSVGNVEILEINGNIIVISQDLIGERDIVYWIYDTNLNQIQGKTRFDTNYENNYPIAACVIEDEFNNTGTMQFIALKVYNPHIERHQIHILNDNMQKIRVIEEYETGEATYNSASMFYDSETSQIFLYEYSGSLGRSELKTFGLSTPDLIFARNNCRLSGIKLTPHNLPVVIRGIAGEYSIKCDNTELRNIKSINPLFRAKAIENGLGELEFSNSIIADCDKGILTEGIAYPSIITRSQFYRIPYGNAIEVINAASSLTDISHIDILDTLGGIIITGNDIFRIKNSIIHSVDTPITADNPLIISNSVITGAIGDNIIREKLILTNPHYINEGFINPADIDLNLRTISGGFSITSPAVGLADDGSNAGSIKSYESAALNFQLWTEVYIKKDIEGISIEKNPVNPVLNIAKDGTVYSNVEAFIERVTLNWMDIDREDYDKLEDILLTKNPLIRVYPDPISDPTKYFTYRLEYQPLIKNTNHIQLFEFGSTEAGISFSRAIQREVTND